MNLLTTVNFEELQQILKRDVKYITDITVAEYQKIMLVKGKGGTIFLKTINHPLCIRPTYEYGWQETEMCANGRFYYILSYDIMMIDLDDLPSTIKDNISPENVEAKHLASLGYIEAITVRNHLSCRVYKTFNGYHIFITSSKVHHRSPMVEMINNLYKGDVMYKMFCENLGFKTRLNKKLGRADVVAEYMGTYGIADEDEDIIAYLKIHDTLVKHHMESEDPYI
jgi:hypothetical protein